MINQKLRDYMDPSVKSQRPSAQSPVRRCAGLNATEISECFSTFSIICQELWNENSVCYSILTKYQFLKNQNYIQDFYKPILKCMLKTKIIELHWGTELFPSALSDCRVCMGTGSVHPLRQNWAWRPPLRPIYICAKQLDNSSIYYAALTHNVEL